MNKEKKENCNLLKGLVVSDKMEKTLVVLVEYYKMHPRFRKYVRSSKRYFVHDEKSISKIGDSVLFYYCGPLSKKKSFTLEKVLGR